MGGRQPDLVKQAAAPIWWGLKLELVFHFKHFVTGIESATSVTSISEYVDRF